MGRTGTYNYRIVSERKDKPGTEFLSGANTQLEIHQVARVLERNGDRVLRIEAQTERGARGLNGYSVRLDNVPTPRDTVRCPICDEHGCPVCNYSGLCKKNNWNKWQFWQLQKFNAETCDNDERARHYGLFLRQNKDDKERGN